MTVSSLKNLFSKNFWKGAENQQHHPRLFRSRQQIPRIGNLLGAPGSGSAYSVTPQDGRSGFGFLEKTELAEYQPGAYIICTPPFLNCFRVLTECGDYGEVSRPRVPGRGLGAGHKRLTDKGTDGGTTHFCVPFRASWRNSVKRAGKLFFPSSLISKSPVRKAHFFL